MTSLAIFPRVPCVLPLTHSHTPIMWMWAERQILYCLITFPVGHAVSHPSIPNSKEWVKTTKRCRGFSPSTAVFSFPQKPTFQIPIIKLEQFSVDCTLINHRNDIRMFKTQVEPRVAGELFRCKVKWEKRKQTAPPSRYFHCLYSHWPKVSTNQPLRNHSVIVKCDLKGVFN